MEKLLFQKISNKLKELDYCSSDYANMSADLNDLYEASHKFIELLNQFISLNKDNTEEILDLLVELQTTIEHLNFHVQSALPSLELMIDKL